MIACENNLSQHDLRCSLYVHQAKVPVEHLARLPSVDSYRLKSDASEGSEAWESVNGEGADTSLSGSVKEASECESVSAASFASSMQLSIRSDPSVADHMAVDGQNAFQLPDKCG